jgi:hypothetical protein
MYIKGKMYVDDFEYSILHFHYGYHQPIDPNGRAYTGVFCKLFHVEIKSTRDTLLYGWMASASNL